MLVDDKLQMASNEVLTDTIGDGTLDFLTLGSRTLVEAGDLDNSGRADFMRQAMGGSLNMHLSVNIQAAIEGPTSIEFQLVSLAQTSTLLDDTAAAPAGNEGRNLLISGLTTGTDIVTLVGHGMPLGTPIICRDNGATSTLPENSILYVIPRSADTFDLADSLALAKAGTGTTIVASTGDVDFEVVPTVHGSSGTIPLYTITAGGEGGAVSVNGSKIVFPIHPLTARQPGLESLAVGYSTRERQTEGAGPGSLVGTSAQRYLYLRIIVVGAITAGTIDADLVLCGDGPHQAYLASGHEVIG